MTRARASRRAGPGLREFEIQMTKKKTKAKKAIVEPVLPGADDTPEQAAARARARDRMMGDGSGGLVFLNASDPTPDPDAVFNRALEELAKKTNPPKKPKGTR